eukprot:548242_1
MKSNCNRKRLLINLKSLPPPLLLSPDAYDPNNLNHSSFQEPMKKKRKLNSTMNNINVSKNKNENNMNSKLFPNVTDYLQFQTILNSIKQSELSNILSIPSCINKEISEYAVGITKDCGNTNCTEKVIVLNIDYENNYPIHNSYVYRNNKYYCSTCKLHVKSGRQRKDATKRAQNTKQIEEEIRNKWTQKLLNENSNGEYNDVVRVLEKNKQLYAHVIRKAAHSLKFKNKYTFGDAIAEIRQRARNHRAPPTSIKNMSGFVVRDSRNSTINTTVLKSVAGVSSSTNDNYNAHTHHMNVNVNNNDNASIKPSYENEEQIISANMSQNGPKSIYKKKKKKKKKKNTNKALPRSKIIIIKMFKKEKNQLNQ